MIKYCAFCVCWEWPGGTGGLEIPGPRREGMITSVAGGLVSFDLFLAPFEGLELGADRLFAMKHDRESRVPISKMISILSKSTSRYTISHVRRKVTDP